VLAEVPNPGAATQRRTGYVSVGNVKVGTRVNASSLYFKTDHLGSISVFT
jgi:hypothetical protein